MIFSEFQSIHSLFTASRLWSGKTVDAEYHSIDVSVQITAMKIGWYSAVETGSKNLRELISTVQILKGNRQPHIHQQDP